MHVKIINTDVYSFLCVWDLQAYVSLSQRFMILKISFKEFVLVMLIAFNNFE